MSAEPTTLSAQLIAKRKEAMILAAISGLPLAMFVCLIVGTYAICDGAYTFRVAVWSESNAVIRSVECESLPYRDVKQVDVEQDLSEYEYGEPFSRATNVEPFDGKPVKVRVPFSCRSGFLNIEWGHFYFGVLLVSVEYADGRRETRFFDIPDPKKTRAMTAVMP